MDSKVLTNVSVDIRDEADKINHGKPVNVKFSINKEEDHLSIEKVPPRKVERDRAIPLKNTDHGASVSYQQKAKKIHIWWFMTSDTLKAPEAELRNEMLAVFDRAIQELRDNDI